MTQPFPDGQQAAAISELIVKTMNEYIGRGPESARTAIAKDVITVLLDEPFTKAERSLIRDGHSVQVLAMRKALQITMAQPFIDGIEAITGRTVCAFLSDNHIGPDISTEVFALDPSDPQRDGLTSHYDANANANDRRRKFAV